MAGGLDLVLGAAGAQGVGQPAPEAVQAGICHLQEPADVPGAGAVEEQGGLGGVAVAGCVALTVTIEEAKGDETVEEVVYGSGTQVVMLRQLLAGSGVRTECGEQHGVDGVW